MDQEGEFRGSDQHYLIISFSPKHLVKDQDYLPCEVEWISAPYSTSTVSSELSVSLQNSRSTSSSDTVTLPSCLGFILSLSPLSVG